MRRSISSVVTFAAALCLVAGCVTEGDAWTDTGGDTWTDTVGDTVGPPPVVLCTYSQGYYGNHDDDERWEPLFLGDHEYQVGDLQAILDMRPAGDSSVTLAHQLIAALLNGIEDNPDPFAQDLLTEAQDWMRENADSDGVLPYGIESGSQAHSDASYLGSLLAAYNVGDIGPGHCGAVFDDQNPGI